MQRICPKNFLLKSKEIQRICPKNCRRRRRRRRKIRKYKGSAQRIAGAAGGGAGKKIENTKDLPKEFPPRIKEIQRIFPKGFSPNKNFTKDLPKEVLVVSEELWRFWRFSWRNHNSSGYLFWRNGFGKAMCAFPGV